MRSWTRCTSSKGQSAVDAMFGFAYAADSGVLVPGTESVLPVTHVEHRPRGRTGGPSSRRQSDRTCPRSNSRCWRVCASTRAPRVQTLPARHARKAARFCASASPGKCALIAHHRREAAAHPVIVRRADSIRTPCGRCFGASRPHPLGLDRATPLGRPACGAPSTRQSYTPASSQGRRRPLRQALPRT